MVLWKLRLTIMGTVALIISISTLFFAVLMSLFGGLSLIGLAAIVVVFNLIQWLLAPKIINALYRVKHVSRSDNPKLYSMVERLAAKAKMTMPKIGIADIPIPNAFAYSSPIGGTQVAVTTELQRTLEDEEVEAVLGHELGHLKHKDTQVMMFVSVLPAIFYFIGYSLFLSGMFGGRRSGSNAGAAMLIGVASIAIYFILNLFVLRLSRLREYYADRHSVSIVDDGARKLSEGLAKIAANTSRIKHRTHTRNFGNLNAFRTLFIEDPEHADENMAQLSRLASYHRLADQELVQGIASRKVTGWDRFLELFSTHPNIVKRIQTLQRIQYRIER